MASIWTGRLLRRINEAREPFLRPLVGGAAKDYADYKYLVGYLDALDEVVRMTQEVDNEMLGGPAGVPGSSN